MTDNWHCLLFFFDFFFFYCYVIDGLLGVIGRDYQSCCILFFIVLMEDAFGDDTIITFGMFLNFGVED